MPKREKPVEKSELPQVTVLLDCDDLAARGPMSKHTWRLWMRQGRIESFLVGRRRVTTEAAYERLIAESRRRGGAA